jgi:hypothetical protein
LESIRPLKANFHHIGRHLNSLLQLNDYLNSKAPISVNSACGIGTAEQWIKEGKYALNWTRLSCHDFLDNQVRLQLFALAYNLGNFLRRLALPESVKKWSLTTLRDKLIKIGATVVSHSRYVIFQMAEVMVSKRLFQEILERIGQLKPVPLGYG